MSDLTDARPSNLRLKRSNACGNASTPRTRAAREGEQMKIVKRIYMAWRVR
jgi:hypothetical protein